MGWRGGGAHHSPTLLMSPKIVFFMGAKNRCLTVILLAVSHNHRELWVGKNFKDAPVPVPHCGQGWHSMAGEISYFKGTLFKDY